jgi:hypothetical protein
MAIAGLLSARDAWAIVVLEQGSSQPVMGYLVRETNEMLVIRQEIEGGKTQELTIPKTRIDEVLVTVSPERLESLDPNKPEQYREYAEELAEKRRDPEARDAARRLFAIAAHRGDAALRHSALLGLISLARTTDDERRLRALAYLHDPHHDETVLTGAAQVQQPPNEAHRQLLSALRLIRQGKPAAARPIVGEPALAQRLSAADTPISSAELSTLLATSPLTDQQLATVLRAEVILESLASGDASAGGSTWSLSGLHTLAPVPPLKLENLTEFDEQECVFKGGRWTKP